MNNILQSNQAGVTPLFSLHRLQQGLAGACLVLLTLPALAASSLTFDELYGKISVLGMEFSEKVKVLSQQTVEMNGFMAPPLKADAQFFVLTKAPMALCPFCSSDADWPADIVVVYLDKKQPFVQNNAMIKVTGKLEYGSWTDPQTGFVSLLRITDARFKKL
ncbi:hypothetical protein FHQ21_00940 [Testudinibacter aquarius]|uniref:DUF3299 domain-containing protein n=1 Tax=Testudinibacter aquarius TaxID=1524974 RepID=A0ABY2XXQ2_9PAST|nr:hypothetical protein FHQ21_00940 [Testudinibacter aquarius]